MASLFWPARRGAEGKAAGNRPVSGGGRPIWQCRLESAAGCRILSFAPTGEPRAAGWLRGAAQLAKAGRTARCFDKLPNREWTCTGGRQ